jgi:hypothetical protein
MKKRQQHNQIASYYIKTVLLFMVEQRNDAFWKQSLSIVFLDTLETYTKYIRNKKIPYYWNEEYNLIGHIDPSTLANFADRLEYIINNIKRNPNQPDTVVEYLCKMINKHGNHICSRCFFSECPRTRRILR